MKNHTKTFPIILLVIPKNGRGINFIRGRQYYINYLVTLLYLMVRDCCYRNTGFKVKKHKGNDMWMPISMINYEIIYQIYGKPALQNEGGRRA